MKQDILYLNLPDSYCQIFLPTENNRKYELELSASLDALEAQLGSRFVRTHRSYLVNPDYISSMERYAVVLLNGSKLPIPKKKYNELRELLLHYYESTDKSE